MLKFKLLCGVCVLNTIALGAESWPRHTIADSSRGADGVRVADFNGDGFPDLVTGWEEGGVVRFYLHPHLAAVREKWPAVSVGSVTSPEDAVFADLDGDGRFEVVSCCEGKTRAMYVHRPATNSAEWVTQPIPATVGKQQWMFCLPLQVDGRHGVDLVVGSKNANAAVGWLQAPEQPRELDGWRYHRLVPAGWIMSLIAEDMDADGDADIVFTDRKGPHRGCKWLENPGQAAANDTWTEHVIGGTEHEVMFLSLGDIDGDGTRDVATATKGGPVLIFHRTNSSSDRMWQTEAIPMPANTGSGKAAAIGDLDGDGDADIAVTCEHADDKIGVFWLEQAADGWRSHDIGGTEEGIKFDRIELLDLDRDRDLDLVTCEERDNLGVIWYENGEGEGGRMKDEG